MGGILIPHDAAGWLDARATQLARDLVDGRPLQGWQGDARLELRLGVLTNRWGRELDRRWEVWRHCEDGADRIIGRWKLDELEQIIPHLVLMDPRVRDHVPSIDCIDAHNARLEQEQEERIDAVKAEAWDQLHFAALGPDRPWRSTLVQGRRDG